MINEKLQDTMYIIHDPKNILDYNEVRLSDLENVLGNIEIGDYLCKVSFSKQNTDTVQITTGENIYIWNNDNIDKLANLGVNLHTKNEILLQTAALRGHYSVVKYLIDKYNSDPNANDGKALCNACQNGNLEVVKFLISKGVNPSCHNNKPISLACNFGHEKVFEYLLSIGICINSVIDKLFVESIYKGSINMLNYLIKNTNCLPLFNNEVDTDIPLLHAAITGNVSVFDYLLKMGYKAGPTSLLIASDQCHRKLIIYLIEYGIILTEQNEENIKKMIKEAYSLTSK